MLCRRPGIWRYLWKLSRFRSHFEGLESSSVLISAPWLLPSSPPAPSRPPATSGPSTPRICGARRLWASRPLRIGTMGMCFFPFGVPVWGLVLKVDQTNTRDANHFEGSPYFGIPSWYRFLLFLLGKPHSTSMVGTPAAPTRLLSQLTVQGVANLFTGGVFAFVEGTLFHPGIKGNKKSHPFCGFTLCSHTPQ